MNMNEIIFLIYGWQTLLGAIIGSALVVFGAYWIANRKIDSVLKSSKKEQFNRFITLMYELKRNIARCEFFIDKAGKNTISFAKIYTPTFSNQWSKINLSNLDPQVYIAIEKIYFLFETVMYNIEKANVVEIHIEQKDITNLVHTQKSIIDFERYGRAVAFIRCYLLDAYTNFNLIHAKVIHYAKKNNFKLPKDIQKYTLKYAINNQIKYKLEDGKLD